MELHRLLRPEQPWLHVLVAKESDACDLLTALPGCPPDQRVSRLIRGHKTRTTAALFDEFAAALQFPCYFGENWDAFDECLTDLAWLPGNAYVILIVRTIQLLDKESDGELQCLLKILESAGEAPAPHPRPPRGFHVLFQCIREDEAAVHAKLTAARVSFDVLRA